MNTAFLKYQKFDSLFRKNLDGTLTPKKPVTILGVVGDFKTTDTIRDITLIDGSSIHEHHEKVAEVRKLGNTFMIMGFSA